MPNYLYNGVELPELPEWDKTTYPYAFIVLAGERVYWLYCSANKTNVTPVYIFKYAPYCTYKLVDGVWVLEGEYTTDSSMSNANITNKMIWANHDIVQKADSNNIFLAASDPVPVGGEPEQPEPETPVKPLYYSKGGVWRRAWRKTNGAWEPVDVAFGVPTEAKEFKQLYETLGVVEPFIYFTDPHLCEGENWKPRFHEYMAKVKQMFDNMHCSLVICGGDWIGNSDTKAEATDKLSYVADYMRRLFGNRHVLVLGNHDTNYQGTEQLTQQELIDLWFKDTNTGKAYYYHDTQTTRFFVLDTQTDWNPEWSEYFQEQRDWLAANLSAELKNVVVAHIDWVDSDLTTRTSLVDAIQYVDGVDMVLAGHIHADHVNMGVVPEVVTTNLQAGGVPTFDLCLLDVENNQLHMIRVGTGENRTINLGGA